jgi:cytochrome P450
MASDSRLSAVMPNEIWNLEGQRNPFPWFKKMRQQGPIRYDENRNAYDVFHYDEVVELSVEYERFGKEGTSYLDGAWMSRDPPIHTDLRSMAENFFRRSYIESEYGPEIEQRAEQLLDQALNDNREFDFYDEVAVPMPVLVIADILGVPSDQIDTFRDWSTDLIGSPEDSSPESIRDHHEEMMGTIDTLEEFFSEELKKREKNPQDDLITKFLHAEESYERLDRQNIVACCGMLLVAGNVTTVSYLSSSLWTFIEEGIIEDLQEGTIELADALEEVLRIRPPVLTQKRIARKDTELAGMEIPEGARVNGWINSANRDEQVFDNPGEYDPTREYDQNPISFGQGIHYCLGAPLANYEAEVLFTKLLDRIENAEMTIASSDISPLFSPEFYGITELPIRIST